MTCMVFIADGSALGNRKSYTKESGFNEFAKFSNTRRPIGEPRSCSLTDNSQGVVTSVPRPCGYRKPLPDDGVR
jgi:hypothetical protein